MRLEGAAGGGIDIIRPPGRYFSAFNGKTAAGNVFLNQAGDRPA